MTMALLGLHLFSFLNGAPLIAQQISLVCLNGPQVSCWIATIMQPVFDQFKIVSHAAAVDSHPVESFNPLAVEAVLFEGGAAEIEAFGCLLFADEEKHDDCA
jgi:hypothetical protein